MKPRLTQSEVDSIEAQNWDIFDLLNWICVNYNGTTLHQKALKIYDDQLCYHGGGTEQELAKDTTTRKQEIYQLLRQQAFFEHLTHVSNVVRTWPQWKQGIWGPALPEEMS